MKTTTFAKITIGVKSKDEIIKALREKDIYISSWAQDLLDSPDFVISDEKEEIELIKITPAEMGLTGYPTTDEIYAKAKELGYELCPAETGPLLRLDYTGDEWFYIAMKQISVRDGDPCVFRLVRSGDELKLDASTARPAERWGSYREFVFRLRKPLGSSPLDSFTDSLTLDSAIKMCKEAGYIIYKEI